MNVTDGEDASPPCHPRAIHESASAHPSPPLERPLRGRHWSRTGLAVPHAPASQATCPAITVVDTSAGARGDARPLAAGHRPRAPSQPAAMTELRRLGETRASRLTSCRHASSEGTRNETSQAISGRLEHLGGSPLELRDLTPYMVTSPAMGARRSVARTDPAARFGSSCRADSSPACPVPAPAPERHTLGASPRLRRGADSLRPGAAGKG